MIPFRAFASYTDQRYDVKSERKQRLPKGEDESIDAKRAKEEL